MLVTRDQAKLGMPLSSSSKCTALRRTRRPFSAITSSTIRHRKIAHFHRPTFGVPVEQAFEYARRYAAERRISTIWIDDPDRLFGIALSE